MERFHSRDQYLCKFIGTKESVYIKKLFNSHRTGLGHKHGRRFIRLREVSLFPQIQWEQWTRAGAAKPRDARNEGGSPRKKKRLPAFSCLSRLARSVTRVAICVSRVLLDGLQKKERLPVVYRFIALEYQYESRDVMWKRPIFKSYQGRARQSQT